MTEFHHVITGTPYFPEQLAFSVLLGWLLGRYAWHRSMLRVWVIPLLWLLWLVSANHHPLDFEPSAFAFSQSRLSHFFGSACRPDNRCFDQIVATLPFYAAAAYSIGAVLARKVRAAYLKSRRNSESRLAGSAEG